jgi:hypothetical protein
MRSGSRPAIDSATQPEGEAEQLSPARKYLRSCPAALDCFLSEEHGFLPPSPIQKLPSSHAVWEEFLRDLPRIVTDGGDIRQMLDEMPLRSAAEVALPGEHLLRAASVLGSFVHAVWHFGRGRAAQRAQDAGEVLPVPIMLPWRDVCRRLKRPRCHLTLLDYVTHNYEFCSHSAQATELRDVAIEDTATSLRPAVRVFNNQAETMAFIAVIKVQRVLTCALDPILNAQGAVLRNDSGTLQRELFRIREMVELMTAAIKVQSHPWSSTRCDVVAYGKTIHPFTQAIPEGATRGESEGARSTTLGKLHDRLSSLLTVFSVSSASPLHVLDAIIGTHALPKVSAAVELAHMHGSSWTPSLHATFLSHLRTVSIRDYVQNSGTPALVGAFDGLVESFAGVRVG